jgi:Ca-activated chloride channel family protein
MNVCRIVLFFLMLLPSMLFASGSREKIIAANKVYGEGDFNRALSLYEEVEIEQPESPYVYFNKGLVHYRLEDYEKAKEEFLQAAIKTKDLPLEAKAYYNLGNCNFFDALRYVEMDLKKAIELYQDAITNYRLALERDPSLADATHNIEVTRLIVKDLLDKLKQQQEQQKEQQEKLDDIAKKIKALIEREQKEIEHTETLKEIKDNKGVSPYLRNSVGKVKEEQKKIRTDTKDVSGKISELMGQGMAQQPDSPLAKAKEHVDVSANFQELAENQLKTIDLEEGLRSEESARDELVKALQALAGQPQGDNRQQEDEEQQKEEQKQDQEKMKEQAREAEDIIDEEEENKKKLQADSRYGYQAPAKDW